MAPPSGGDPPYDVALADVNPTGRSDTVQMRWHRVGDELHGNRLISTSTGNDARARGDRPSLDMGARNAGSLVLLLDLLLAGFFWLLGALAEKVS